MKQFSLFPQGSPAIHGGELAVGKRKARRPLARKRSIHLVLKARRILSPERPWILREARRWAARFGIRVYGITGERFSIASRVPTEKSGRDPGRASLRAPSGLVSEVSAEERKDWQAAAMRIVAAPLRLPVSRAALTATPLHRYTATPLHRYTATPRHRHTATLLRHGPRSATPSVPTASHSSAKFSACAQGFGP